MNLARPRSQNCHDFNRFCYLSLKNHKGGPRDYIFNDYARFVIATLKNHKGGRSTVDLAITFFNDFDLET